MRKNVDQNNSGYGHFLGSVNKLVLFRAKEKAQSKVYSLWFSYCIIPLAYDTSEIALKKKLTREGDSCCYEPAIIYLFKVNNRNIRKRCEIYSKLTIKSQERLRWYRSGAFI